MRRVLILLSLSVLGLTTASYAQEIRRGMSSVARLVIGDLNLQPTGTRLTVSSTASPTTANNGESLVYSYFDMGSPGAETTGIGVQGYVRNTGSVVGTTAHHIGVLGLAEDTANGRQTLYGVEGKVEGRGTAGSQNYVGGIFFGNFEGSAFAGTNVGIKALANVTTDGVTPLNQGLNIGLWIPSLIGGATKLGILTYDLAGMNGGVLVEDSTSGVGLLVNASGTSVFSVAATTGAITQSGLPLASLGAPANGTILYCTDCTYNSNPCTGGSTGAIAKRINGAWRCD